MKRNKFTIFDSDTKGCSSFCLLCSQITHNWLFGLLRDFIRSWITRYGPHLTSSMDKQDLIFSFIWLKEYNLKVNWQKRKVVMIQYPVYYFSCQNIKKYWEHTLNAYRSGFFFILEENCENVSQTLWTSDRTLRLVTCVTRYHSIITTFRFSFD